MIIIITENYIYNKSETNLTLSLCSMHYSNLDIKGINKETRFFSDVIFISPTMYTALSHWKLKLFLSISSPNLQPQSLLTEFQFSYSFP